MKSNIVIVGAGFAGVKAARELDRAGLPVTLISKENGFAYYPQMYHAATGGVRSESWLPLGEVLGGTKVTVIRDEITSIDPDKQVITGASGQYPYDEVILALGNVTNYFGIQGLEQYSYGIKTIRDAEEFKGHLHQLLVEDKLPDSHYVVIGGGPTGVELAGALPDYLRSIMRRHGIQAHDVKIELVEAAPRILPRSEEAVSRRVTERLKRLGVEVITGMQVKGETAEALQMGDQQLTSKTVVWTAGVANNPFFEANVSHFELGKGGKVTVNEFMQASPHIWVIGDNAATEYSGLAQTAVSDGVYAAHQIIRGLHGQKLKPYHAKRPITVIPVGAYWAVVSYGQLNWYGWIGWVMRRAADLIGYADIESWAGALRNWFSDRSRQDNCPICDAKT